MCVCVCVPKYRKYVCMLNDRLYLLRAGLHGSRRFHVPCDVAETTAVDTHTLQFAEPVSCAVDQHDQPFRQYTTYRRGTNLVSYGANPKFCCINMFVSFFCFRLSGKEAPNPVDR